MSNGVEMVEDMWYNTIKARVHAQDIGTAEELPALDAARGQAEIGADDSKQNGPLMA